jgi:hypothetical protein
LVREIAFYAKTGDLETSRIAWEKLCLSKDARQAHFDFVLEKFSEFDLGKGNFLLESLRRSSREKDANPLAGGYLIKSIWLKENEKSCLRELEELRPNKKIWAGAAGMFMELMLGAKRHSNLSAFIKQNRAELGKTDEIWGLTGYALVTVNDLKQAPAWFSGWEKRERVMPWMVWNYSLMLRNIGKIKEATDINRAALNLETDDSINQHMTMLALEEIYAKNYQTAADIFGRINPAVLDGWNSYFYFLLELGLEIYGKASTVPPGNADESVKQMVNLSLAQINLRNDGIMRENFKRSVKAALGLTQNLWLKIWLRIRIFFATVKIV